MRFPLVVNLTTAVVGSFGCYYCCYTEAFCFPKGKVKESTAGHHHERADDLCTPILGSKGKLGGEWWWGPVTTAVATLTLAGQVSVASVPPPTQQQQQQQQQGMG